jgi:poly(hydroxyalkanoate) depolymerase family esterase
MRSLSDTLGRLARFRQVHVLDESGGGLQRLRDFGESGSNPGSLAAKSYVPANLCRRAPPLVVVLHGCMQTAADYDRGSGWSQLADQCGFVLLLPEQQRSNNPNLCFNWFESDDRGRGAAEARSIRHMVEKCIVDHDIDRRRIFITGLSAGGAMTSVMLAKYPELFAGGAIIAGLPYGCAASIPQAFDRMRGHGCQGERELQALLRGASKHPGPWPTVSVWHGTADHTVSASNADAIVGQWRALHGLGHQPTRTEIVDGYPRRVWCDANNHELIEAYSITGMGHGTPLNTAGANACGVSGPYMLDVSISSTRHIANFWGLTAQVRTSSEVAADGPVDEQDRQHLSDEIKRQSTGTKVGAVIENALRTAGLMR